MTYDRDIRWMRLILWVLVAVDLIWAGACLYRRDWPGAIACGIWTINIWSQLGTLASQQKTRDEAREVAAAIHGVMEGRP